VSSSALSLFPLDLPEVPFLELFKVILDCNFFINPNLSFDDIDERLSEGRAADASASSVSTQNNKPPKLCQLK
jgi:hypothetical protein